MVLERLSPFFRTTGVHSSRTTLCSTLRLYYVTTCPPHPPPPLCFGFCRSSEGGREKKERSHSLRAELWLEKKLKNTDWVLKVKLNTLYVYNHYMDSRPALPIANVHGPRHGLGHGHWGVAKVCQSPLPPLSQHSCRFWSWTRWMLL